MAKEKRAKGCLKGCLGFFLLVIVAIMVLTGVVIHKLRSGNDGFEVVLNDSNYQSAMDKAKTVVKGDITDLNLMNIYKVAYITKGSVDVDNEFSSSELSSVLSKANELNGPVRDIRINLLSDNNFEISCQLDKSIMQVLNKHLGLTQEENPFLVKWIGRIINNKPVHGKGSIELISENIVDIHIEKAFIGSVPIKGDSLKKLESEIESMINSVAKKENGIALKELSIKDGALHFKGTLPGEISGK